MSMSLKAFFGFLGLGISALYAVNARADTKWVTQPHVRVQLISSHDAIAADTNFFLGIHFSLEKGWHIYWVNPGDSGLATTVSWDLSSGASVGPIDWPAPERIELAPLMNYGYSGDFLLTMPATATQKFSASGKLSWLVCKQECIPGGAELSLEIPLAKEAKIAKGFEAAFAEARHKLPKAIKDLKWRSEKEFWVIALPEWKEKSEPYFFSEEASLVDHAGPQIWKNGELWIPKIKSAKIEAEKIPNSWRGIISAEGGASPWRVNLDAISKMEAPAEVEQGFLWVICYALLGGILLNLMPCVFPVLALKALGLAKATHSTRRDRIEHAIYYSLGIQVSFWILAALVLGLRAAGIQIGWGFQLQSPIFVSLLCLVLVALGLNLLGAFEVAGRFMGWGQSWVEKDGAIGIFASGVLTVLVATPCTAPFMATAMGVALLQPGATSMLIFIALGLGLSLPYVLLSLFPAWHRWLPKPGAWMQVLKEIFAFPLFATALWLFWLFGQLADSLAFLGLGFSILGLCFIVWAQGKKGISPWTRGLLVGLGLVVLGLGFPLRAQNKPKLITSETMTDSGGLQWQNFSAHLLEEKLKEGKAVFIDFTASWCISCQANEKLAFSDTAVIEQFKNKNIELLRADWTNYDPLITEALQGYARVGVPLYVYYPAGSKKGHVLPQVLTPSILIKALE